ncbi:hypothetical protein COU76_05945 [Candidatus Peregrinibacteria bacterium CG10_big_fil_rev_8_21_14_0_10_49_10]|nr:MAG: hypothetical protein COU76_05945 [Candidatus Peregrinibacteria bacterium CG10_big_fil_rev_8_21_14_0_10_49_10]
MEALFHPVDVGEKSSYETQVLELQAQAAKQAATVGQFRTTFHRLAEEAIRDEGDAESLREAVHGQETLIDDATDGVEHLGVESMPLGQLGEARIGGEGRLSQEMLGEITDAADAKQANHAGHHEQAHMESVQLSGDLVLDGQQETRFTLFEAFAELKGNEGVGEGEGYFRHGQPEDYNHAQKVGMRLRSLTGNEFDRTLTDHGDVGQLQEILDEKGHGRTQQMAA